MSNIQETLQRYKSVSIEKDSIEKELYPYLRLYCGYGDILWSKITPENQFEWTVEYSCRGEADTNYYSVSLDYFDNPQQYIAREQELNKIAAKEKKEKERLKVIEQEKEMLAKLKEKYEND